MGSYQIRINFGYPNVALVDRRTPRLSCRLLLRGSGLGDSGQCHVQRACGDDRSVIGAGEYQVHGPGRCPLPAARTTDTVLDDTQSRLDDMPRSDPHECYTSTRCHSLVLPLRLLSSPLAPPPRPAPSPCRHLALVTSSPRRLIASSPFPPLYIPLVASCSPRGPSPHPPSHSHTR